MKLAANRFNLLRQERLRLTVTRLAAQPSRMILARAQQPLGALELTTRSENCLRADNIETIDQLLQRSRADLLRIPNCGRLSVNEIEEALRKLGLHLKGRTS